MAKLSVMDEMIYNKFKTRREKGVTLMELADVKWNGNKPDKIKLAMKMGGPFDEVWRNLLRQHIIHINKLIEPDEIITRTVPGTYMLTKRPSQKFSAWIARELRNFNSIERTDKLLQDIEPAKLPPIPNGKKLEDAKKDSHSSYKASQENSSWARRIYESMFKGGKMLKPWRP